MAKASDNLFPKVTFAESAAPATPASGRGFLYEKTDGKLYFKDDAGTEYDLTAGAGGGSFAWQAWSPTLKGSTTDPTIGDGTVVARYMQIGSGSGSLIICKYYFEFGSTSNDGAGAWRLDGPVTPYASYDPGMAIGGCVVYDASTSTYYHGSTRYLGGAQHFDFYVDGAGKQVDGEGTIITWATGDRFSAYWQYEAA